MNSDVSGRIAVFAGPSLPSDQRPTDPIFAWLEPATAGDSVALRDAGPRAVVLIDGLFDSAPAIRHKELLGLISGGVPVIGAASMGALRAAELHSFGMIGVGRIFAAYRSGLLIGDDEVAVLHGPEAMGFAPLTEPMVNIRATLERAARLGIVDVVTARRIRAVAAGVFYKERTWPALLEVLGKRGVCAPGHLGALRDWLPGGAVNLKQRDALAGLQAALSLNSENLPRWAAPPRTLFAIDLEQQVAAVLRRAPTFDARR